MSILKNKFESFGWESFQCDGHSEDALNKGLRDLFINRPHNKPGVLILDTVKGKGIDFMENSLDWHYGVLDQEHFDKAMLQVCVKN